CIRTATTLRWRTSISTSVATFWKGSATWSRSPIRERRDSGRADPAAARALEDLSAAGRLRPGRLSPAQQRASSRLSDDAGPVAVADAAWLDGDGLHRRLHHHAVPGRPARTALRCPHHDGRDQRDRRTCDSDDAGSAAAG